jgi:hypothetical protein
MAPGYLALTYELFLEVILGCQASHIHLVKLAFHI